MTCDGSERGYEVNDYADGVENECSAASSVAFCFVRSKGCGVLGISKDGQRLYR